MDSLILDQIKKLREETGAGVVEAKKAIEESLGDYQKALQILVDLGASKLEKKADRAVGDGLIEAYVHATGKVGALLSVRCETDFVARTEVFKQLAHEIAMQIAAVELENPTVEALLDSEYIRDPSKKVADLISEAVGKLGENIRIEKFTRFSI